MQGVKTTAGRAMSHSPDKHYAQVLLLQRSRRNLVVDGATTLRTLDDLMCRKKHAPEVGFDGEEVAEADGLLGAAQKVTEVQASEVVAAFKVAAGYEAMTDSAIASWTSGAPQYRVNSSVLLAVLRTGQARIRTRAELYGMSFFSELYHRTSTRVSHWVLTYGVRGGGPHVARVKYYLQLPPVDVEGCQQLDVAIVELFVAKQVKGMFVVDVGAREGRWSNYAVPIRELREKLVLAAPHIEENSRLVGTVYFLTYDHYTSR